jgi:hypothetical protein
VLFGSYVNMEPCTVYRYDISAGTPQLTHKVFNPGPSGCGFLGQMEATGDGSLLYLSAGSPYQITALKGKDLTNAAAYTANPYPGSVALTADGGSFAAGMDGYYGDNDLIVFKTDGTRVFTLADQTTTSTGVWSNGLEFADDGRLFAIFGSDPNTVNGESPAVQFRVYFDTTKFLCDLVASLAHDVIGLGQTATITGALTFADAPTPAGALIHVVRSGPGGSVVLPNATTDASGQFTLQNTPAAIGTYQYTLTYDGDPTHRSATKTVVLTVQSRAVTSLATSVSRSWVTYPGAVRVTAHMGTTHDRSVSILAQPYGGYAVTIASGSVDSNGDLSVLYTPSRRTTFWSRFTGDDAYAPATSGLVTVTVAPSVTGRLQRSYGSAGRYRLYHAGISPVFTGTLLPVHYRQCMYFSVQHYSRAWRSFSTSGCYHMHSNGIATITLPSSLPRGRYRMLASFRGDSDHLASHSSWYYFEVTS